MGYVPSSDTQTLYAYLTQKGRQNLLFGDKTAFTATYFSLHDNDVNYNIASKIINFDYNKLKKGFVPDITGDNDDCIRSVAESYIVDENSYLIYGGTPQPPGGGGGGGTGGGGGGGPITLPKPVPDFTASTLTGFKPLTVQFTDKSTNMAAPISSLVWEWDFQNDGTIDSQIQNPSHTYTTAGVYSVKLRVANEYAADSVTKDTYITVQDPPLRQFQIEFVNPTNLSITYPSPSNDWLHRQKAGQSNRTSWSFGQATLGNGNSKTPSDVGFFIRYSFVDPTQTTPTQEELNSLSFNLKLVLPFVDTIWIERIYYGPNNSITNVNQTLSLNFGTGSLINPYNNSPTFEIKQSYFNNSTLISNVGSVLSKDIDFNFELESTSPNLVVKQGKGSYRFVGQVQGKRTA
jgi:PKD repeat protein